MRDYPRESTPGMVLGNQVCICSTDSATITGLRVKQILWNRVFSKMSTEKSEPQAKKVSYQTLYVQEVHIYSMYVYFLHLSHVQTINVENGVKSLSPLQARNEVSGIASARPLAQF